MRVIPRLLHADWPCRLAPERFEHGLLACTAGVGLMIFESGMHFDFEKAKARLKACKTGQDGVFLQIRAPLGEITSMQASRFGDVRLWALRRAASLSWAPSCRWPGTKLMEADGSIGVLFLFFLFSIISPFAVFLLYFRKTTTAGAPLLTLYNGFWVRAP